MTRGMAYWVGFAMLCATLTPLVIGAADDTNGAFNVVGLSALLLVVAGADRLIGREIRPKSHPVLDVGLVLGVIVVLTPAWGYFSQQLLWEKYPTAFLVLPASALGMIVMRVLTESRAGPFVWAMAAFATMLTTCEAAYVLGFWGMRHDTWVIVAQLAALMQWAFVGAIALGTRVFLARPPKHGRRLIRTGIAGALLGVCHLAAWCWLRVDAAGGYNPAVAAGPALWTTVLMYAVGPTVMAALMGSWAEESEASGAETPPPTAGVGAAPAPTAGAGVSPALVPATVTQA